MDIVTGFGGSAATEAGKYLVRKVKKNFGYLYKYEESLRSLEVAAEMLGAKRNDASRFAEDTNMKQKDVTSAAAVWKSQADELHQKAQKIISRNNISCLHPWLRYSTSKHAWEFAEEINEKIRDAPDFGTAFDRLVPNAGAKLNLNGFMEFDSRLTVLNGVLEALQDEEVSMCSICGMGGVGKTMLAKKLILRVEADHLFDKVAMVTVSQNPNPQVIQNVIIELLGLTVDESTMPARASKLNAWLTSNNRTLLILDDVWWQLNPEDFENIGIPLACKGCKIVVTSRNEDECKQMGCKPNFLVNVLKDGEAWDLFRQKAGKCVEDFNLQETARKIAAECDGLPIAIVALATALKKKRRGVWNDSLVQLQKSNLDSISGMDKVFSRIELSYDLLNDREAQSCFLLCCLFPEDHNVPVESLVFYAKGLQLFENVESISATRDRMETKIDKLKQSFLLLDGEADGSVKMHDILRHFAISISSKEKHPYIMGCEKVMEKWPESSHYENCSAISLVCRQINKHPVGLRCPKLELLQVLLNVDQVGLPVGIFEELKELKVLVLKVRCLLQSLSMLTKLRTLLIEEISFDGDLDKIRGLLGQGDLKNLEILAFATNRLCYDFPAEIGLLCNLKCLKFSSVKFKYMPPGVLSKLVKLEELELSLGFRSWGCKEEGGTRVNASLDEIHSLPLTTLEINVGKDSILSETLVKSLTKFHVAMGIPRSTYSIEKSNSALQIFDVDACEVRGSWISGLLRKCKIFISNEVRNLKNIMWLLPADQDNEFPQLKHISICRSYEMEYLVDTIEERIPSSFFSQLKTLELYDMDSLIEICPFSKIEASCFINLSMIHLNCCSKLKHLFPLSVAIELRQLHTMHISRCEEMEEVFFKNEENQVASSVQLVTPTVESTSTATILNPNANINDKPQLISCCPTPNSFIHCLPGRSKKHPNTITKENIAKADEKEVDDAIMDAAVIVFPRLKTSHLFEVRKLRILYDGDHAIELPSLEKFTIWCCNQMEAFSRGMISAPRLKEIDSYDYKYPAEAGKDLNAIYTFT